MKSAMNRSSLQNGENKGSSDEFFDINFGNNKNKKDLPQNGGCSSVLEKISGNLLVSPMLEYGNDKSTFIILTYKKLRAKVFGGTKDGEPIDNDAKISDAGLNNNALELLQKFLGINKHHFGFLRVLFGKHFGKNR